LLATFDNGQLNKNNEPLTGLSAICKCQVDEGSFNGQENHQMLNAVAIAFTIVSCATFSTCKGLYIHFQF
jgi:hypothetical protein